MNISTGGPHILLFERDQQLTALITSEFQLAGYECHTARTAVEVFDALARYPIRIVLVDLAQAAAARREFWVALDTQRRGRGIHVLTFHCTNIAGYGPQDPDDRAQNVIADLDIDGMLGLMKLVDEVRARVPGSTTSTLPRIPRATPPPQTLPQPTGQGMGAFASSTASNGTAPNGATLRTSPTAENTGSLATIRSASSSNANASGYVQAAVSAAAPLPASGASSGTTTAQASTKSVSYTDKIRAVLYPNQRNWTTQISPSIPQAQEPRVAQDTVSNPPVPSNNAMAGASTMLQRLANGQEGTEGQVESGLAQLSRLAQASQDNNRQTPDTPQPASIAPMRPYATTEQSPASPRTVSYAPAARANENIGALRASPIQDIPVDRPGNKTGVESSKRPEVLSHTNYGQPPAPLSSLASITMPSATATTVPIAMPDMSEALSPVQSEGFESEEYNTGGMQEAASQMLERAYNAEEVDTHITDGEANNAKQQGKFVQSQVGKEKQREEPSVAQQQNTMLFDIMQSLPPMPPVVPQPAQSIQAQVVNGRATRSLGSVLLAGHLVPQNRLEVAESIQRMLRGVDLNYQLGEILLMFKLLTPDQLLAASLVSYGMITTTQISALGRIRQELHAIGLEYDLESLLILFRILTPEQLREAKSASQG